MTTVRGLTQAIYYFYRQLGVTDVKVKCTNEFCHWFDEKYKSHIEYSLSAPGEDVLFGYSDYIKKHHPEMKNYPHNFFTFSLLHELGHSLTLFSADISLIEKSRKALINFLIASNNNNSISPRKRQARYCEFYIEKIANEKAIELIKNNYEIIQKFEKRLEKLVA